MVRRIVFAACFMGCAPPAAVEQDAAPACKVEGTYTVHYLPVTDHGTCVLAQYPADALATVTVSGTHAEIAFEGHPGYCSGLIDGCSLTSICSIINTKTNEVGSLTFTWDFLQTGFTGHSSSHVPLDDGGVCTLNEGEESVTQ